MNNFIFILYDAYCRSYDDLEKSEFDEEDSSFKPVSERSREV